MTLGVILVAVGIAVTHVEAAGIDVEDLSLMDGTFDGYNYFVRYIFYLYHMFTMLV